MGGGRAIGKISGGSFGNKMLNLAQNRDGASPSPPPVIYFLSMVRVLWNECGHFGHLSLHLWVNNIVL